MAASFVAFMNMKGIVCAADNDMTLHSLSRKGTVALAVNPDSRVPWARIIDSYLNNHKDVAHKEFKNYAMEFNTFLSTIECENTWKKLTENDGNIIFLGFGESDVFPVSINIQVEVDSETNRLSCKVKDECRISHDHLTSYNTLTDFDEMNSVLFGITKDLKQRILDKHTALFGQYKARITKALAGLPHELEASQIINDYDAKGRLANALNSMRECRHNNVETALDSFNIEDLVHLAETFVDSQDQLRHLKAGGKGPLNRTQEIAVITRTEGLVWIKHCIYGL